MVYLSYAGVLNIRKERINPRRELKLKNLISMQKEYDISEERKNKSQKGIEMIYFRVIIKTDMVMPEIPEGN